MLVAIPGQRHDLWRAVDPAGEVPESVVTRTRDKKAALKVPRQTLRKHGRCAQHVTDKLRSCGAAMKDLGVEDRQDTGRRTRRVAWSLHGIDDSLTDLAETGSNSSAGTCTRLRWTDGTVVRSTFRTGKKTAWIASTEPIGRIEPL
jgi:hypothetical protein